MTDGKLEVGDHCFNCMFDSASLLPFAFPNRHCQPEDSVMQVLDMLVVVQKVWELALWTEKVDLADQVRSG